MSVNKFKFYTPLEIKKSKNEKGEEIMKMGGIASTIDEDSDGEFLDPNGFVMDDFMKSGLVNWHHQVKGSPKTIVGEPTKAEIKKEGMYIECELYPASKVAQEIYETAQILEANSSTRRLGFSIEGEVLQRGSNDKNNPLYKKVLKANITGVAITHMPKNPKTFANIIKALGDDDVEEDEDELEKEGEVPANGEGITTANSKSIIKEDLDEKLKVTNFAKSKYEFVDLDEEKMYDKIFDTFPVINIQKAEKVFTILTKISQKMKTGEIKDEQIEKAMAALGLDAANSNPFLVKAKAKAKTEEEEDEEAEKVAKKVQEKFYDRKESDEDEKDDKDDKEVKKALPTLETPNAIFGEIEKSRQIATLENRAIGVLVGETLKENAILKGKIDESLEAFAVQNEAISQQNELIKGLMETIENFGAVPNARKSIAKTFAPRFEGDENIQKGKENNAGGKTLSVARNRAQILEVLDHKTFEKGFDEEFSKACLNFEASGNLPASILNRIREEEGITITQ